MNKVFSWVEIPVRDIERAAKFYGRLFDLELAIEDQGPRRTATLYFEAGEVGGSLLQAPGFEPGAAGAHVYLNAGRDLGAMIERVESLGGKITIPATPMDDVGHFATFQDTEGNTVSLFAAR